MSLSPDVIERPPSAADLAWEADRLTLDVLPAEQRAWFENLSTAIREIWPDDDGDPGGDEFYLDSLLDVLGEHLNFVPEPSVDEVEAALRAALDQAEQEGRAEGVKDATVPSRATAAQRKAMRLLVDGRVSIVRRDTAGRHAGLVHAKVRGDSDVWDTGYDPHRRQWRCTCPATGEGCSHVAAVKLVCPTGQIP